MSLVSGLNGRFDEVVVELTVPEWLFKLLPEHVQDGDAIEVHPVLYTMGINEMQSIANMKASSNVKIQGEINKRAVIAFEEYLTLLKEYPDEWCAADGEVKKMEEAVTRFRGAVEGADEFAKTTEILAAARAAVFALHGGR